MDLDDQRELLTLARAHHSESVARLDAILEGHGDKDQAKLTEEAAEARFEIFMDELEAHADAAFGEGRYPEVNRAARALMEALEAAFVRDED